MDFLTPVKPIYKVGDKLKLTQEFLDKTKWPYNFDYIQVDSFRTDEYHYDTPIINGEYARYYCISGWNVKPFYTTGTAFKFWISEINMLPLYME